MDDEHQNHKGCFCFESVIQNWLTSTGKTLKRAQADMQFCKTNCFVWCEPKSVGKKSKCGSIRSQPLLGPSKRVVLGALCMSVFSSFYFCLDVFIIPIFPAFGIFLDGSHWVMGCSPPGKFTSFITGYIAMWLHCCPWVMNEITGLFCFFWLVWIHWNPACPTIRPVPIKPLSHSVNQDES